MDQWHPAQCKFARVKVSSFIEYFELSSVFNGALHSTPPAPQLLPRLRNHELGNLEIGYLIVDQNFILTFSISTESVAASRTEAIVICEENATTG